VAIARALITRPALLLADEPTGNLDSKSSVEIMRLFEDLHRQGITVVLVTHEPDIAAHAARVLIVHDGQIASDGSARLPAAASPAPTPARRRPSVARWPLHHTARQI
jgi:putative ABC transport system ATP-binding protein